MSTTIAKLTPQGLVPVPYTVESLREAIAMEPDGIYDVTRIYTGGEALLLDAHFDRIDHSAKLENIPMQVDRPATRRAVKTLFERSGYEQARLRFAVGYECPDEIILSMESFAEEAKYLAGLRAEGVAVGTHTIVRSNPRAKTNAWVRQRQKTRAALGIDAYEVIICSQEGKLLEGFSSNFYAVQEGRLYTSLEGVLPGIMRKIVLEFAPDVLPLVTEPVNCERIADLQEAFLTSSTRGIIPIVKIDDIVIGDGKPGPYTQRLLDAFDQWVAAHLEPIA